MYNIKLTVGRSEDSIVNLLEMLSHSSSSGEQHVGSRLGAARQEGTGHGDMKPTMHMQVMHSSVMFLTVETVCLSALHAPHAPHGSRFELPVLHGWRTAPLACNVKTTSRAVSTRLSPVCHGNTHAQRRRVATAASAAAATTAAAPSNDAHDEKWWLR